MRACWPDSSVRKPPSTVWLEFGKWFSPVLMSSLRSLMAIPSCIPDPFWVALCRLCLIDWTWHHREHQFHHYGKLEHKLLYLASRSLENLAGHLWIESPLAATSPKVPGLSDIFPTPFTSVKGYCPHLQGGPWCKKGPHFTARWIGTMLDDIQESRGVIMSKPACM
jgi:hypothetical protein